MKAIYYGPDTTTNSDSLLGSILSPISGIVAVDTETISLSDNTIIGIGLCANGTNSFYFPLIPVMSEVLFEILDLLARKDITKVLHNATFDIIALRKFCRQWKLPEIDVDNIQDTSLLAQNNGLEPDLHTLGNKYLQEYNLFTVQSLLAEARIRENKKIVNMLDVPINDVARKCNNDVRVTFNLLPKLRELSTDRTWDSYRVDIKLLSKLKHIEDRGFKLDHDVLEQKHSDLTTKIEYLRAICENEGFNPGSTQQVGMVLAQRGMVMPLTKSGKQLDTSEEQLEKLSHPLAKVVLEYRGATKLDSTYVVPWLNSDRAFTHFRLDLSTGRLASFDRNMQNIPPDLRNVFNPDNDIFTWGDMSQAEMRVFAYLSQDPVMLEAYTTNKSLHEITFRAIYPHLQFDKTTDWYVKSKTFNFAMIFNASDNVIAAQTKTTVPETHRVKQEWFKLYPRAYPFMQECMAVQSEYVEDIFGRKMRLPDANIYGPTHVNTCKINYPVQGSTASINKRALLYIMDNVSGEDIRLQVHDEFVNDGPIVFPKEIDEIYPGLVIPFEVKEGPKWS